MESVLAYGPSRRPAYMEPAGLLDHTGRKRRRTGPDHETAERVAEALRSAQQSEEFYRSLCEQVRCCRQLPYTCSSWRSCLPRSDFPATFPGAAGSYVVWCRAVNDCLAKACMFVAPAEYNAQLRRPTAMAR